MKKTIKHSLAITLGWFIGGIIFRIMFEETPIDLDYFIYSFLPHVLVMFLITLISLHNFYSKKTN